MYTYILTQVSQEELKADEEVILNQLLLKNSKFAGILKAITTIKQANQYIHDAFSFLVCPPSAHDLSIGSCFVVSLAQEILIYVLIRRVLQVMTAEAIILHQKEIPTAIRDHYLRFQSHFSIKGIITKYLSTINDM